MIPLAEDIEILTAGYLSALKSNSDEIVRLADALHAAEAELSRHIEFSATARNALTEQGELLAKTTAALSAVEIDRNTATAELVEIRLALINAEACRAEAEKQMHAAEAEHNEMRNARDRAEKARADDYRQQTETVRALLEQRDATRTDAERLAAAIAAFIHSRRSDTGLLGYERIILELESALAAHKAATGKAVTG